MVKVRGENNAPAALHLALVRALPPHAVACSTACVAVAAFAAHESLRAALLHERSALGEAALRLTRAAWDEDNIVLM